MLLTGCLGGSGSASKSSGLGSTISGVAATGAPISNGKVEIKGSNGAIVSDTTSADGSYSANIGSLSEPYLVRVIAPSGEKYISVASQSALAQGKKINVTPLTHTIVANVFNNANADDVFSNFESESDDFSEQKLEDEKDELFQKFVDAGLIGAGKIADANVDLLNGNLQAGTSIGVDGLLDVIQVNTDAAAGIEIKLKGSATALIVDKVDAADPAVVAISPAELAAAEAQLDVLSLLRIRMNSLAALHSSKVVCNGAPVDTVDNSNPCDVDNLYSAFLNYFHPQFQTEGVNRENGLWGWFCRVDEDHEAISKAECLASGEIFFENVSLKDITLINYDALTNVAQISFNFYLDGVLKGSEDMLLKLDNIDNLYKLFGNLKTFKYWIDTESLHDTLFDKNNSDPNYQGTDSYSVNLNFYFDDDGAYSFNGGEVFTLNAVSGHTIFPGNSSSMSLYLIQGPKYNDVGSCTAGLVFSTTPNPYKTYNHATGVESYTNFATACAFTNDPCNCRPSANEQAYLDHDKAQKITLSNDQMALMDKIERITLSGAGVSGDSFTIKKPLVVNEFNASTYIPHFGMSVADFCRNSTFTTPLNLSVASGTLNYLGLSHGYSSADNSMWNFKNDSEEYWDSNLKTATFVPNFSGVAGNEVIRHSHLYLSSRDEYERQFVRRISCQGN